MTTLTRAQFDEIVVEALRSISSEIRKMDDDELGDAIKVARETVKQTLLVMGYDLPWMKSKQWRN
jgi:hypothetical protein